MVASYLSRLHEKYKLKQYGLTDRQFLQFTDVVSGHHESSLNHVNSTKILKSGQALIRTHVTIGPYLWNWVFKLDEIKCI